MIFNFFSTNFRYFLGLMTLSGVLFVFLRLNLTGGYFESGKKVLGESFEGTNNIKSLLNEAAYNLSSDNKVEGTEKLRTILQFDPTNKYALSMLSHVSGGSREVYLEIDRTLTVLKNQPDWQAAWFKLASLYDRLGETKLAEAAREKARKLKTT